MLTRADPSTDGKAPAPHAPTPEVYGLCPDVTQCMLCARRLSQERLAIIEKPSVLCD
jgi:hypothetical protein